MLFSLEDFLLFVWGAWYQGLVEDRQEKSASLLRKPLLQQLNPILPWFRAFLLDTGNQELEDKLREFLKCFTFIIGLGRDSIRINNTLIHKLNQLIFRDNNILQSNTRNLEILHGHKLHSLYNRHKSIHNIFLIITKPMLTNKFF